jgi:hypothetical protein
VSIALVRRERKALGKRADLWKKLLGPNARGAIPQPSGSMTRREEEEGLLYRTDNCRKIAMVAAGNDAHDAHGCGRWLVMVSAMALLMGVSGCTYNPLLGKWKIDQRTKETYVTYVDPLSSNIKKQTGNDTLEFNKDSITISGGSKPVTEEDIHYQVTELAGGAGTEVKIYQPRKDDPNNYDIDVFRVAPDGKTAHLETPSEVAELKRIE